MIEFFGCRIVSQRRVAAKYRLNVSRNLEYRNVADQWTVVSRGHRFKIQISGRTSRRERKCLLPPAQIVDVPAIVFVDDNIISDAAGAGINIDCCRSDASEISIQHIDDLVRCSRFGNERLAD